MKTSEVLKAGRALIDTPEKWTKGVSARMADGRGCSPWDDAAVCFCSIGALDRLHRATASYEEAQEALKVLRFVSYVQTGIDEVFRFNDSHSHAEVLAVWDAAIKIAKEAEYETH